MEICYGVTHNLMCSLMLREYGVLVFDVYKGAKIKMSLTLCSSLGSTYMVEHASVCRASFLFACSVLHVLYLLSSLASSLINTQ